MLHWVAMLYCMISGVLGAQTPEQVAIGKYCDLGHYFAAPAGSTTYGTSPSLLLCCARACKVTSDPKHHTLCSARRDQLHMRRRHKQHRAQQWPLAGL